jgi:hypothetical protein
MRARGFSWLAAAVPLFVTVSCVTVPDRPVDQWLGVLPDKGTLYLSMSVAPTAASLKKAFADAGPAFADLGSIVDMTKKLYASVTLVPDQGPRLSAVALGSFPSFFVGMRLGTSADWKGKNSAAGSWFENSKAGLQVSVPADSVLVASTGDIETLLPRLAGSSAMGVPPEVLQDMESTDIVLYLPELPPSVMEKTAGAIRIPIKRVWLRAQKNADGFEVGGTATTETEKDAKLLAMVMRLALVAWLRSQNIEGSADRLSGVTVKAQGAGLVLSGLVLKDSEIAPLILSLVSGPAKEPEKQPETRP